MPIPSQPSVGQRPSIAQRWWVLRIMVRGSPASYTTTQDSIRPNNTMSSSVVAGPFTSQDAASTWINTQSPAAGSGFPDLNPLNWLKSAGANIGSGIETGFVSVFKDLWNVIIGPLEVLIGVLIALWVLVLYFKQDLIYFVSLASLAAR